MNSLILWLWQHLWLKNWQKICQGKYTWGGWFDFVVSIVRDKKSLHVKIVQLKSQVDQVDSVI